MRSQQPKASKVSKDILGKVYDMIWKDGEEILFFKTQKEWEDWLEKNHAKTSAIWLKFFKKASGVKALTYDEALDIALCFGWIDGVVNKYDENSYLQRFTPRRAKSNWSKVNTQHIERLTNLGKMRPSGLEAVVAAKVDGRWEQAYNSPANAIIPDDFLEEIKKHKKAKAFFDTLSKSNRYFIAYQIETAKKEETRERRKKVILEKLEKGEKFT